MKTAFSLVFAAALLALCGLTTARAQGPGELPEVAVHHKINARGAVGPGFAPATGGTTALSPITYHGGALIQTPTAYVIWYGNWNQANGTDTPGGQDIVRNFFTYIGNSPYFSLNTTYSAGGYTINGNVVFGGETSVAYPYGTRLSDSQIQQVVTDAINGGKLPYRLDGVYFVLTSSDVTARSGFCTRYCGWHTRNTTSPRIRYSFCGNAARCLSSCAPQTTSPNGNAGVDGMVSVIAHELEEATTDPDVGGSGWVDSSGYENADKCAWTFGHAMYPVANGSYANMKLGTRDYLIQRNLSATDNKCYVKAGQN